MPFAPTQAALIRQTYRRAGLDPVKDRPQYFECHGTGTPAGDPVEARAISEAFVDGYGETSADNPIYVGSIKTIVGHLEGCAGLAGVMKVLLAIKNRTIPPNLLFNELNPAIAPYYRPLRIATTALPWPDAVELRTQLQEEESLGPVPLRPDLLSVLDDAKTWCLRCIEAGETNIKGYLLMCVVAAQIEGLMRGLGKDEVPGLLVKAAEDAEERCLPILEEMAAQSQIEGTVDGLHQMSLDTSSDVMEDWDFMMSDALFNPGNAEPMSWMFNDETTQGPSLG